MSATAADALAAGPLRTTSDREPKLFELSVIATAAGAIVTTALKKSDTTLSITKNVTTGQYDLVFPKAPGATGMNGRAMIEIAIYSPASTVGQWRCTARDFAAGTASVIFATAAGVDAYLASGDELDIQIWIDTKPGK